MPMTRSRAESRYEVFKRLAVKLSLDHHSQGLLVAAVVLVVVARAWWSLPGLVLYAIMHFQYGGQGTFQSPARNNEQPATIADLLYLTLGVLGLALFVAGLVNRTLAVLF